MLFYLRKLTIDNNIIIKDRLAQFLRHIIVLLIIMYYTFCKVCIKGFIAQCNTFLPRSFFKFKK